MIDENIYVQWIGFLNHVFMSIKENGWLSAQDEILDKAPEQIKRFPLVQDNIYYEFTSDIFDMCVNGEDIKTTRTYAQQAILCLDRYPPVDYNQALIHCIWNTIDCFFDDNHPYTACEFGRVSIPHEHRPKREVFSQWIRQLNKPEPVNNIEELYVRADAFIESIKPIEE